MKKAKCPICGRRPLVYQRGSRGPVRLALHDNKEGKACGAGGKPLAAVQLAVEILEEAPEFHRAALEAAAREGYRALSGMQKPEGGLVHLRDWNKQHGSVCGEKGTYQFTTDNAKVTCPVCKASLG